MAVNVSLNGPASRKWRMRFGLVESFVLIFILFTGFELLVDYNERISTAHKNAESLFVQMSRNVQTEFEDIQVAVNLILHSAKEYGDADLLNPANPRATNALFIFFLRQYPVISSINTGDAAGNGYLLLRTGQQLRNRIKKGEEKGWATWINLGEKGEFIFVEKLRDDYDPRTTPWYRNSVSREEIVWSDPYSMRTTRDVGITASMSIGSGKRSGEVIGADIMLKDMSQLLAGLTKEIKGLTAHLLTQDGTVIASSEVEQFLSLLPQNDEPLVRAGNGRYPSVEKALQARTGGKVQSFSFDNERFLAVIEPVSLSPKSKYKLVLTVSEKALAGNIVQDLLWKLILEFLLLTAAGVWYFFRYINPIIRIVGAIKEFGAGKFRKLSVDAGRKDEIGDLASEFITMTDTLTGQDKSLRESEARYRSLFENMLNGFAYCQMLFEDGKPVDFIYLAVNDAFDSQTGLKDVVGRKVSEVIPGIREADPQLFEVYGRVAITGQPESFEIYVEALSDWYSISVYSPASEHFVAVFDVITERKLAERSLAEKEAQQRILIETIPDLVWLKDADGIYLLCNKMFEQFFGAGEADIVGKTDYDFVSKELADFFRDHDRKAMEAGKPSSNLEWITFASDGHRALLNTIKTPMRDAGGKLLGVLGIGRDITEYHKLEEQLLHSQKMESIGTLAGGIAHDFNNILSAIIGYGEFTLMKMAADDQLRHNIESMLQAADRATHLTKELLLFSRKQPIDKKPVDLNEVVTRVEKFLKKVIGEDISFRSTLYEARLPVFADPYQLEQVLMNLATNARDSIPQGGSLTVTTAKAVLNGEFAAAHGYGKPGPYAFITVSDTGTGMDEATQKRIFEPFFTTKEVGKGTGLGLSVAYGIIKQHDGFINVYSEPGTGTTFRIYLPLDVAETGQESPAQQERAAIGGTETILLAEDDEQVRILSASILENAGYTVIAAVDGADAVRKFAESGERIDLLLLDLIMPKMNGKEAFDKIRELQPEIKVIFASGYAPETIMQKASMAVGAHMITKPILPTELLRKVRSVLDGI
jgi:PAS domain S-box-containing protein